MTYVAMYAELHLFCALLLILILVQIRNDMGSERELRAFKHAVWAALLLPVMETLWIWIEHDVLPCPKMVYVLLNMLILTQAVFSGYCWLMYVFEKLVRKKKYLPFIKRVAVIPLGIAAALNLISVWTGWTFSVDAQNTYTRGPLYGLVAAFACIYPLCAILPPLYRASKEKNHARRNDALILALFALLPTIGGIVQVICYGLPLLAPTTTLSLLMIFINTQKGQILLDALTGLNNRRRAYAYLDMQLASMHEGERLVFFMFDLNKFKQINDNYGHIEGDRALCVVAVALQQVCNRYHAFLARLSGDEFCIAWRPKGATPPGAVIQSVHRQLQQECEKRGLPYQLSLGAGYVEYTTDIHDVEHLISLADAMLYQDKAAQRSAARYR